MDDKLNLVYQPSAAAICISDIKSAALFYENVTATLQFLSTIELEAEVWELSGVLDSLSPHGSSCIFNPSNILFYWQQSKLDDSARYFEEELCNDLDRATITALKRKFDIVDEFGFNSGKQRSGELRECISFFLSKLPIVDTNNLSWKHIAELRNDRDGLKSLTDLKLILYEDYNGKPKSFAEDRISQRIEKYQDTLKTWGMKTALSSLEVIFSHKNAAALAGFGSAAFGAPFSVAGMLGASATIGTLGVHLKKRQIEKLEFANGDPIRYLVNVQEKVEKRR